MASLLAELPVLPPPKGQKSDFNSPAPDAKALWAISLVFIFLALLAVIIRLYVKRQISKQRISWDDGACIVALILGIIHVGTIINDLNYGLGKHMWNVRVLSLTHLKLLSMTSANLIVTLNMLFVRIAVLALYQRLFGVYETSKKLIYTGYFISLLIALPEASVAIGRMVRCSDAIAGITVPFCTKKRNQIAIMAFAIAGVLTDIFIYSIAIFRLRQLQVKTRKKLQLAAVFGVGLSALFFGIANLIFNVVQYSTDDQLWYALWVAIFKMLEADIALTCACITFLPAFWKSQKPVFSAISLNLGSNTRSSAQDHSHSGPKPIQEKHSLESNNNGLVINTHNIELGGATRTDSAA